tara:strand:- start:574 stop:834 length:261 start_codon:yes stop_codon:yes gene_type:complete
MVVIMVDRKLPADIRKLSFEEALAQLEEIVRDLESGDNELDSAIESYSRGVQLQRHCEERLKNAQEKIEKIALKADAEITSEPLDN